ncbi:MAG: helix-turn-helix domain-containing protein, partial [Gammaproteobacteria bacterium]|nr:helix-turn-helix domain-containing protein [Gammaproteobacteria bacterium]
AQADLQRYFRVSPPSVHRMVTQLADQGLITKQPGVARSLSLAIPLSQLPALD